MNSKLAFGVPIALLGLAVLAYLAFGVFGIHTAFIDETVDEANPFEVAVTTDDSAEQEASPDTSSGEVVSEQAGDGSAQDGDSAAAVESAEAEPAEDAAAAEAPAAPSGPVVEASGSFVSLDHPAVGTASVISDPASGQRIVRFEEFETDNGPDLFVYLAGGTDANAPDHDVFDEDFVNLGRLTGNIGAQNYVLDPSVDVGYYDTVVIWCDRFDVAFAAADLQRS